MKIWMDLSATKDALFFNELARRLSSKGYDTLVTGRKHEELNQLMDLLGMDAVVVGRHGGKELYGKLLAYAERVSQLARIVKEEEPDLAISYASPEAARVAFGLGIPHYCVNDTPHADAVNRLTLPLSKMLFTPWIIPHELWTKYGISRDRIVHYKAIDVVAWIRGFKPNPEVLEEVGLEKGEKFAVIRPEEYYAAYLLGRADVDKTAVLPAVEHILSKHRDVKVVLIPRSDEQRRSLERVFGAEVVVAEKAVDFRSLVCFSSLFVGAGGTMNWEAALLGVPTISCFPGPSHPVENFFVKEGLVYKAKNPKELKELVDYVLSDEDLAKAHKSKAEKLVEGMEDPVGVIAGYVQRAEK